ncbi:DUF4231 domain-containing protein [Archangium sp.]|uniref:DUF4231 domain-containing protein n=1 Tax=Archangium sp. TaxID=1872627 RepID=UPI00286B4A6B|nr:DUF4231 domain-containing protein [Archangium sp.]
MPPESVVGRPSIEHAVNLAWEHFRRLDVTSVRDKQRWLWKKRALLFPSLLVIVLLPIGKALLPALLGEAASAVWLQGLTWFCTAVAALLAFVHQLVGEDPNQRWIRTRAAAESLKSEVFRFLAAAAPYDKAQDDKAQDVTVFLSRVQQLLEPVSHFIPESLTDSELREGRPTCPATPASYLAERVEDQIRFFTRRAVEHDRDARRTRGWTWFLGGLVVLFGASAPFLAQYTSLDMWIPVLTLLSATLATQLYMGRNEFQAALYQGVSSQLAFLKTLWLVHGEGPGVSQSEFVARFEDELSKANGAWLSEWSRQPEAPSEKK